MAILETPSETVSNVRLAKVAEVTGADTGLLAHTVTILFENFRSPGRRKEFVAIGYRIADAQAQGGDGAIIFTSVQVLSVQDSRASAPGNNILFPKGRRRTRS